MKCMDCDIADHDRAAVGVCRHCGCGACSDHAVLISHLLTRTEAISRAVPIHPPARLLLCLPCAAAVDAASAGRQASATASPIVGDRR